MHVRTLALVLTVSAVGIHETGAQTPTREPPAAQSQRPRNDRDIICRGAQIPTGWILVDDTRSTDMCGGSNPAVVNMYNVWAIERFDNKPVGATMQVCAAALTPAGWVVEDVFRSREHCGHPDDPFVANVKRIRRVR